MPNLLFMDIETDNLLYDVSQLWCITAYDEDAQEYLIYHLDTEEEVWYPKNSKRYRDIYLYLSYISKYTIVGHNIISYDMPALGKLFGLKYSLDNLEDTHILSRLFYPDRDGHSLEWWGDKLRFEKGDHTDFTRFSNEMLQYNIRDVDLTRRVWYTLQEEGKDWDWSKAKAIEYRVWHLMREQEQHGVLFDSPKARMLSSKIQGEIEEIEEKVLQEIPKKAVQVGATVTKPFLKSGELTKSVKEWLNETPCL